MNEKTSLAYACQIFMAGDIDQAKQLCAQCCMGDGLCVTVTPTEFIYNGGREMGFIVGLVNYPRFPKKPTAIRGRALALAYDLIIGLAQHSALIQDHEQATWITRRPEELSVNETRSGE